MSSFLRLLVLVFSLNFCSAQDKKRVLLLKESADVRTVHDVWNSGWEVVTVTYDRKNSEQSRDELCSALAGGGLLLIDYTYYEGWVEARNAAKSAGLLYLRIKSVFSVLHQAADEFLVSIRKARDTALIYQYPDQLDESLYYLVHESPLRVILFEGLSGDSVHKLQDMRPTPSYFTVFANTKPMNSIFKTAIDGGLTKLNDRWNLVFSDFAYEGFDRSLIKMRTLAFTINTTFCCGLSGARKSSCLCKLQDDPEMLLTEKMKECADRSASAGLKTVTAQCRDEYNDQDVMSPQYFAFQKCIKESDSIYLDEEEVSADFHVDIRLWGGAEPEALIASWSKDSGPTPLTDIPPVKRFFRVGTGYSIPFGYPLEEKGKIVLDKEGKEVWVGYCIDLINKLAELMEFDFELTTLYDYGQRYSNGSWDGLVGLLASARIDMIIAPLTMTSEREEVIDFIAPYFEQTGLSIVIRKPVREVSLFKFMTVLKVEVWISILAALVSTAIMIWFLDKYSPYSARNNKDLYPYPCRDFTLKESFWFAVTSFTPQGGGEAPKPLSARTLVAAYWLFVVLMLATFTANLAAFLTVERMQSPVQSLEQLAKQSRINYTVVADSNAHMYFKNMKNAEDTLYRVWKEITLNASSDQTQYRVWDYPIKEQYSRILLAIIKTGTVSTLEEGYKKVIESEQGEFALIHDALEIKYQVDRNCNITEIGEAFAEQPYAIAVQQGSQLNEEISRRILDLQRDRYLEELTAKYWNASLKGECNDLDENEGITLESLGGVFIATLVGLALSMITLAVEVFYQRKKDKKESKVTEVTKEGRTPTLPRKNEEILIGDELFTAKEFGLSFGKSDKTDALLQRNPTVSYISVYPRGQLY